MKHIHFIGILMVIAACGGTTEGGGSGGSGGMGSGGNGSGGGGQGGNSGGMPVAGEAAASPSCAPNDGPAFTIEIGLTERSCASPTGGTVLRLSFWTNTSMPAGHTWDLSPNAGEGQGTYTPASDPANFVAVETGTLAIDTWGADSATGSYDVILKDGTHLSGSFDAIPCLMNPAMCG